LFVVELVVVMAAAVVAGVLSDARTMIERGAALGWVTPRRQIHH
jgi:hypothetical protein